ncbi:ABC transporter ATP-binding protein [Candidatus Peregrinibacteria bacterium]|nr:ABC transporter ATP-binding protein [Candidatus Peregrinibacteria bacterium]
MQAIEIKGLVKQYANGPQALKGVDLNIKEGDFFALLGANGAGKTTLINTVTGLVNKTAGSVKVFGIDNVMHSEDAKKMVGVVPQEFNFNIFEKVSDILVTYAGYFGVPRSKALDRATEVMTKLELLAKRDAKSMQLSGGMKRRLMIARALMHQPKLLILDEPTAGVDVELRHGMWNYLRELNNAGTTILLTTHYLEEVEQMCRNVAIIKQGEIIKNDSVKGLLNSMESQVYTVSVDRIGEMDKVRDFEVSGVDENTIEVIMKKGMTLSALVDALRYAGMEATDVRPKNNRLEQLYLNILNS